MGMLGDQDSISKKTPMPVNDVTVSTDIISSGTETIAFYYSNSGTRTIDAGQAAGTAVQFVTDKAPVYNAAGSHPGDHNDTSFAFGATDTFDSEVMLTTKDYQTLARTDLSWASKLTLITTGLSNGEYKLDYTSGIGYGIKKDGDASETATYLTRGFQIVSVTTGGVASGVVNYTEDVAAANPIVGGAVMMERDDTLGTLTPVEGDWASLRCNANGALWVQEFSPASRAVTNAGTFAVQASIANGADVTLGAKADDKSTATDTTAVSAISLLKEISYMEQNPASRAVTGTFWQTTQPVSVATIPSHEVTNAGTFAVQQTVPTVLTGGSKTVTTHGTAEALASTLAIKSVYVRAKLGNTSFVCVGDSAVDESTNQQIVLYAGESVNIDIADIATVYVDADSDGEGVDYLAVS